MPRDDWAKAKSKQIGKRELAIKEREKAINRSRSLRGKWKAKKSEILKVKAVQSPVRGKVTYEPMICMDCERVTTTEDKHVRQGARVLCAECGGFIMLLHQYDADRDECELDIRLKASLDSSL